MALFYLNKKFFNQCVFIFSVGYLLCGELTSAQAAEIDFNTDVLDVNDRSNIDLGLFSRSGYIMPGEYLMEVQINKQELHEQLIRFVAPENDAKASEACISPELVEQLGLKTGIKNKLSWWHQGQCLAVDSLEGMTAKGDIGSARLYLNIPQVYLDYASKDWDPPSRWDNGISGLTFDYNVNTQAQRQQHSGTQSYNVSGNGTVGANVGPWRLRADWQTRHQTHSRQRRWDWSRYYAYRALPQLGARLMVGENYLTSDIFDSFRFHGASLVSDDNMLPPNLRGYAPEVTGIAKTIAKVTISQQGRVLQETQVAAGAFRIQDIQSAISGPLDVRVEEQDGSVQIFKVDTASVPFLTRPGAVRYKIAVGQPSDINRRTQGPLFGTGEFSWGINNGWSLFGGGVADGNYHALSLGTGQDMKALGALSFNTTQSWAKLPAKGGTLTGGSYRLSYSKRFNDYDNQLTFTGYRFSQKNYMSMREYLGAREYGKHSPNSKQMYTIIFSQQLRDWGLSVYLDYQHQTYWDRSPNDRYNLTLARYVDIGKLKNLSLSLSAYRNVNSGINDDGMYLSLSMPWGDKGSLSYSGSWDRHDNSHHVNFYERINDHDNYQLSSRFSRSGVGASGFYSHQGDINQMNASVGYQEGRYASMGASFHGGATATLQGAALHRSGSMGGTRMMIDTGGVSGIPVRGNGASIKSNRYGKVVVPDMGSYHRNRVSVDLNNMPDNAEALRSVVQATLTEGAIGYRKIDVIAGEKAMAVIRLADGTPPPFGASVLNMKKQEVGIVSDSGSVYLSGMNGGEAMTVHWDGTARCIFVLPDRLPGSNGTDWLLPCKLLHE